MKKNIALSGRLKALTDMVTIGNTVCDVGCDHGFVPIYLVKHGISPRVIAMDVNEGPLKRAEEHIKEYGVEAYIELRLSDGLRSFREKEADSLICAGMGGRLMMHILDEDRAKTDSFKELILQPQSELQQFRCFLRSMGYLVVEENMIEEDGKFYPMMRAVRAESMNPIQHDNLPRNENLSHGEKTALIWKQRMEDRYGAMLIREKSPVLYRYLEKERRTYEVILKKLSGAGNSEDITGMDRKRSRYTEIETRLYDCVHVMEEMNDKSRKFGGRIW